MFFHSLNMFNLFDSIFFVDRDIKRQLSINVDKFNKWYFWITNVLDVTKDTALIFSHNFVNRVINLSLLIFFNVINQNSHINVTIWQVQFCGKWSEVLHFCLWIFLCYERLDSKYYWEKLQVKDLHSCFVLFLCRSYVLEKLYSLIM